MHEYEWCDSFSAARNESMKYAKEDFIFWLDADDVLPPVAALKILNAAYTAPFDVNAFIMVVRFPDGTQVDHLKLFRNLKGLEWLGRHHEQILPGISKFPGRIERIRDAFVYHKNQDRTPEGLAIKAAREDIDLRKDLEDQPDHPFFNFNWGMTLVMRGEDEESLEFLRKSIDLGHGESHVRKSYALLGLALSHLGDVDGALEAYDTGLEEVGEDDAEINYQLAILLASLDGFAEAKEHLLAIPGDISGHFSSLDVKILGPLKFHWLGLVCLGLEQYAEAREWFRKAAAAGWGQSAIELFKAALEREDFKAARESCDLLQSVEGFSENWAKMGADLAGARGESAEGFLLDASRRVPTAPGPRLVHARLLLAAGREAEAESQLEFLENIRCAEGAFLLGMLAFRRGDIEGALAHTEKAAQLDPNHAAAKEQLENLRGAQGSEHHG